MLVMCYQQAYLPGLTQAGDLGGQGRFLASNQLLLEGDAGPTLKDLKMARVEDFLRGSLGIGDREVWVDSRELGLAAMTGLSHKYSIRVKVRVPCPLLVPPPQVWPGAGAKELVLLAERRAGHDRWSPGGCTLHLPGAQVRSGCLGFNHMKTFP